MASMGAARPAQDFVVLPPKHTTELDLVNSLGKYISQRYSRATRKELDDALRDLQQQRLDVSKSVEYSEGVMSGMWRYHGQLTFVEQRFPISPQSLNLVFRWTSAFEPSSSFAGASINLERVSVLWNIAHLYSRAGAATDRSTSEGAKHACSYFQLAAGVLEHAKGASSGIPARLLAWDSSADGLAAARAVMLAQAQSCYYEKAAKDSMSDTVLARLAIAGHNQFNEALSAVEKYKPAHKIWSPFLETHAALFAARAAYRQGKSMTAQLEAERKGYGVQIAWYRTAMGCCEDAVAAGQRGGPITAEGSLPRATAFLSVCKEVLEDVERDNRLIYMEAPAQVDVRSISPAMMAKDAPLPVGSISDPDADLFARLEEAVKNDSSCSIQ